MNITLIALVVYGLIGLLLSHRFFDSDRWKTHLATHQEPGIPGYLFYTALLVVLWGPMLVLAVVKGVLGSLTGR